MIAADDSRLGSQVLYGFLPITQGLTSAPVVVNLGEAATDVVLYAFDSDGQLVFTDAETLKGLEPGRPFAAVINDLVPSDRDVYLIAESVDGNALTGVGFVFNQGAEPAIGNVTAVDVAVPQQVPPVSNILVEDQGDQGHAGDLLVTFDPPSDDSAILEYRVMLVPEALMPTFGLSQAAQLDPARYEQVPKTGDRASVVLGQGLLDSAGAPIQVDVPYVVFVLSVGDGAGSALASADGSIRLATQAEPTLITYISNDGVMLTQGERKVFIDAIHQTPPGNGWVVPTPSEMASVVSGNPPYDAADLIMITHNHGDHYGISSVRDYVAASPQTLLLAPPQVGNNFSDLTQLVDVTPPVLLGNRTVLEVNGITVEVLHLHHFNIFGNDFSAVENFAYLVHLGGKKFLHMGDVELSPENITPFGLQDEDIDVVFFPTFSTLVGQQMQQVVDTYIQPRQVVALHLLSGDIAGISANVRAIFPDAWILTDPFETYQYPPD